MTKKMNLDKSLRQPVFSFQALGYDGSFTGFIFLSSRHTHTRTHTHTHTRTHSHTHTYTRTHTQPHTRTHTHTPTHTHTHTHTPTCFFFPSTPFHICDVNKH